MRLNMGNEKVTVTAILRLFLVNP